MLYNNYMNYIIKLRYHKKFIFNVLQTLRNYYMFMILYLKYLYYMYSYFK
jgi:hypothetical protein